MELLKLLVPELVEDGHNVSQATADADRMIVSTALATAASMGKTVTVYANDTDVIIMLLHHWKESMTKVVRRSDIKHRGHMVPKQLDI